MILYVCGALSSRCVALCALRFSLFDRFLLPLLSALKSPSSFSILNPSCLKKPVGGPKLTIMIEAISDSHT